MILKEFSISGPLLVKPTVSSDCRGYFFESWHRGRYEEFGIDHTFVQDNVSLSNKGVLRGLHFQNKHPQGKIITVLKGAIYDVAVDLRVDSPTFSKWIASELRGDELTQLWIPPGFAHGFYTLEDSSIILYKCTDYYHPEDQHTLLWSDPDIGIDWPTRENLILSPNDQNGKTFTEIKKILSA